jgi:hypothetical protein
MPLCKYLCKYQMPLEIRSSTLTIVEQKMNTTAQHAANN